MHTLNKFHFLISKPHGFLCPCGFIRLYDCCFVKFSVRKFLRKPRGYRYIFRYLDLLEKQELSEDTVQYIEQIRNRSEVLKELTEELFRYMVIC